jgi:uncharacterized protein YecE (DUF72 family)
MNQQLSRDPQRPPTLQRVRVGIGGWTYEPWRGTFYPPGLVHRLELEYASQHLSSIEINGTFYAAQTPEVFAHWREQTPADFVFALKAPRYATHRRVLASAGRSVERFLTGGVLQLREKLGPINWQLSPQTQFDAQDLEGFLKLLPQSLESQRLRHALEVRHESFRVAACAQLARHYGVALVVAADSAHPQISDLTAPFIYARLMGTQSHEPLGYGEAELDKWAQRARSWSEGATEVGLASPLAEPAARVAREVFLYFINGHKLANPQAAQALMQRLQLR